MFKLQFLTVILFFSIISGFISYVGLVFIGDQSRLEIVDHDYQNWGEIYLTIDKHLPGGPIVSQPLAYKVIGDSKKVIASGIGNHIVFDDLLLGDREAFSIEVCGLTARGNEICDQLALKSSPKCFDQQFEMIYPYNNTLYQFYYDFGAVVYRESFNGNRIEKHRLPVEGLTRFEILPEGSVESFEIEQQGSFHGVVNMSTSTYYNGLADLLAERLSGGDALNIAFKCSPSSKEIESVEKMIQF